MTARSLHLPGSFLCDQLLHFLSQPCEYELQGALPHHALIPSERATSRNYILANIMLKPIGILIRACARERCCVECCVVKVL